MTIKTFIYLPLLSIIINHIVVSLGILVLTRLHTETYPGIGKQRLTKAE